MITFKSSAQYGCSGQYIARITGRDSKFTFNREFIGRRGGKRNDETKAEVDEPGLYEVCSVHAKRGKESDYYVVVSTGQGDGLRCLSCDQSAAMKIAKELDGRTWDDTIEYVPGYDVTQKVITLIQDVINEWADKDQTECLTPNEVIRDTYSLPEGTQISRGALTELRQARLAAKQQELATAKIAGVPEATTWRFRTAKAAAKAMVVSTVDTATEACWAAIQALPATQAKEVLKALKLRVSPPAPKPEPTSPTSDGGIAVETPATDDTTSHPG